MEKQGHPKNLFHATAYSEAVAGGDRPADSGPRAGAGESAKGLSSYQSQCGWVPIPGSFYDNLNAY